MPQKAVSAGGVVLSDIQGSLRIALARDPEKGQNAWVLPKGHVKPGESLEQTALREIREETGLHDVRLISYLGTVVRQSIEDWGETVEKTTHFYLAYAVHLRAAAPVVDPSVTEMKWFEPHDAVSLIPFAEDRQFLQTHLACLLATH